MSKQIIGTAQQGGGPCDVEVMEGNRVYELPPRNDEVNHSPSGFSWGFMGSGPAQLSFAILADLYGTDFAHEHYQRFKKDFVSSLDQEEDFTLDEGEVDEWRERAGL